MMPDIFAHRIDSPDLIPLKDVPRLKWLATARGGRPPCRETLRRWSTHGLHGVVLKIQLIGGTPTTTEHWLREFFTAVTEARQSKGAA